jgi:hypothetical protein
VPLARLLGGEEGLEDPLLGLRIHPLARVRKTDLEIRPWLQGVGHAPAVVLVQHPEGRGQG